MLSTPALDEDVLSRVVQFVSSPRDLLAIGLSSRRLFSLAEPELTSRTIRCHLNNDAVWEHLIANPAMAARVRELEILRENPGCTPFHSERVPSEELAFSPVVSQTSTALRTELEKSERLLIQALHVMVNLESFTWDRWVPVINAGCGDEENPVTEDIWTALRDHTQLKQLSVVDLGQRESIVDEPYPIFRSSIFTLRNLTHVKLKVYYSPSDPAEGSLDSDDDDEDSIDRGDWSLHPARVNTARLKEFLHGCPGLQVLELTIIDRLFYWNYDGIPYTDATSIFEDANWPSLQSLNLWDLTVNSRVMFSFLLRHPNLLSLGAGLSLDERDLPKTPFMFSELTSESDLNSQLFLPNIRSLDLKSDVLGSMKQLITYPWSVQSLEVLTPWDWGAPSPFISPNILSAMDAWCHTSTVHQPIFNFREMPHLRSIVLTDLRLFSQLEKLAELTPQLEVLHIRTVSIPNIDLHPNPYMLWLPTLFKWPHLKAFGGVALWSPSSGGLRDIPQEILQEIAQKCPNLRQLGDSVEIVQQNGRVVLQVAQHMQT